MACLDQKPGAPLDDSIKLGIRQTMSGQPEAGAMTMLKHEQQDTLQQSVYDSTMFRRTVDIDKLSGYRIAPMQFVVSSECTSADVSRVVNFANYKGDLYDFDDRWPFTRDCANKFIQLSGDSASSASIAEELNKIANVSP
jgi:hypothetical protein